jgi:hypothetical protein
MNIIYDINGKNVNGKNVRMCNPLVHTGLLEVKRPDLEWEYQKTPRSRQLTVRLNKPYRITLMPSANLTRGFPIADLPGLFIRKLIKKSQMRGELLLVCKAFARLCGPYKRPGAYVHPPPPPDTYILDIPLMWWFFNPRLTIPLAALNYHRYYTWLGKPMIPKGATLRVYGHPGVDLPPDDDEWYYVIVFAHKDPTGAWAQIIVRESCTHWYIKNGHESSPPIQARTTSSHS